MILKRLIVRSLVAAALGAICVARSDGASENSVLTSNPATWGQVLLVGEEAGADSTQDVAELYDPLANRFADKPPAMRQGRGGATVTVIAVGKNGGKVLIAGGLADDAGPLASTELYDPATDSFATGPGMTIDRDDHTATWIAAGPLAGAILIVGGNTTDLYNPLSNKFLAGPRLAHFRIDHTATVIPSGPNVGKILLAGGLDDVLAATEHYNPAATEIYDPATNAITPGPPMNLARQFHTATVIPSGPNAGDVLLIGGLRASSTEAISSIELYDPATNTFALPVTLPDMQIARGYHTATVIPSGLNRGKILIAGGQQGDDGESISATEMYDPSTDRFLPGPHMLVSRTQHAAITVTSGPKAGRILIAAGFTVRCEGHRPCNMTPLASTEFYDTTTNTFVPGPQMSGAPGQVVAVQLPPAPFARTRVTQGNPHR